MTTAEMGPTLEERCGEDASDLLELIEDDHLDYVNVVQGLWEEIGADVLGCFDDVRSFSESRLVLFLTSAGLTNGVFVSSTLAASGTVVLAPLTAPVAALLESGEVARVGARLVHAQVGLGQLVTMDDESCRLVLAVQGPRSSEPEDLAITLDAGQTSNVIEQAHGIEATSLETRVGERGEIQLTLRGRRGVTTVTFAGGFTIVDGPDASSAPTPSDAPCPQGWWRETAARIAGSGG